MGHASLKTPATLPGGAHAYAGPRGPVRGPRPATGGPTIIRPRKQQVSVSDLGGLPQATSHSAHSPLPAPQHQPCPLPPTAGCLLPTGLSASKEPHPPGPTSPSRGCPFTAQGSGGESVTHLHLPQPRTATSPPRPPPNKTEHVPVASRPSTALTIAPRPCLKTPPRPLRCPCRAAPHPPCIAGHPWGTQGQAGVSRGSWLGRGGGRGPAHLDVCLGALQEAQCGVARAVGAQGHQLLELLQVQPEFGSSERARDRTVRPGSPALKGNGSGNGSRAGGWGVANWTPAQTC